MHTAVLIVHVASGCVGLLVGPVALRSVWRAQRHAPIGRAYHYAVAMVCASAIALAVFDWQGLWWFVPIALGSYAFVFAAQRAARRGGAEWPRAGVRGVGGSYIALWTAVAVVSAGGLPLLWFVPTAVGSPAIERIASRIGDRARERQPGTTAG